MLTMWQTASSAAFFRVLCSFVYEMAVAQPAWLDVGRGLVPSKELFTKP
jgi:Mn2+/Fe2+ NRAMP family transporter